MPTTQGVLTGDLNDLEKNSLYIFGAGSTASNMPPNSNQSRIVVLTLAGTNEAGSKVQIAFVINTAKLYTRPFMGVAWGQWNGA